MKWISAKKKKPPESENVIAYGGFCYWIGFYDSDAKCWHACGDHPCVIEVTHWMALPDGPG